jgi:hypothetical protein
MTKVDRKMGGSGAQKYVVMFRNKSGAQKCVQQRVSVEKQLVVLGNKH